MLDSALEPSYNLPKNLLLLPWIMKLIVYMLNDSTPLFKLEFIPGGFIKRVCSVYTLFIFTINLSL